MQIKILFYFRNEQANQLKNYYRISNIDLGKTCKYQQIKENNIIFRQKAQPDY